LAGDDAVVLLGDGGPLGEALRETARRRGLRLSAVSGEAEGWQGQVMAYGPAVLLVDLEPVRAGEAVFALREGGWGGDVVGGPALAAYDFVAVAEAAATGAMFLTSRPFPQDIRGGDAFIEAYGDVSRGERPGPLAVPAYEAAWAVLEAVARAATDAVPTRQSVSTALRELERREPSSQADGMGRRLILGEPHASPDGGLVWYRIGSDGTPRLIDDRASASSLTRPTSSER
jgi:hypothetical protein